MSEEVIAMVASHDTAIDHIVKSIDRMADSNEKTNDKIDTLVEAVGQTAMILERIANIDSTNKDSVNRLHKRINETIDLIHSEKSEVIKIIEVLSDRYRCDGADLPFSVVGQGVVSNVIDGDFPIEVAPIVVPQEVQMYQARNALVLSGIPTSQIDTIIAGLPSPQKELAQNQWEYAPTMKRYNSWVEQLAPLIPLTSTQLDDLFILASEQ